MANVSGIKSLPRGNQRHRFVEYSDGRVWEFLEGEDYTVASKIEQSARSYACNHGYWCRIRTLPGKMLIQFVKKETGDEAGGNGSP